jgi:hypothetical protein
MRWILGELSNQNLTVSPTYEDNGQINFLDFLLVRKDSKIDIDVHCKPTSTDTTISFFSDHPTEQKMAA